MFLLEFSVHKDEGHIFICVICHAIRAPNPSLSDLFPLCFAGLLRVSVCSVHHYHFALFYFVLRQDILLFICDLNVQKMKIKMFSNGYPLSLIHKLICSTPTTYPFVFLLFSLKQICPRIALRPFLQGSVVCQNILCRLLLMAEADKIFPQKIIHCLGQIWVWPDRIYQDK